MRKLTSNRQNKSYDEFDDAFPNNLNHSYVEKGIDLSNYIEENLTSTYKENIKQFSPCTLSQTQNILFVDNREIDTIENMSKSSNQEISLKKRRKLTKTNSISYEKNTVNMVYNLNSNGQVINDYELQLVKNGEELRRLYIAKLISKKVWEPCKKAKDHNSLIIFDWDDTLLCTSFLTPNGIFNEDMQINDKDNEKLAKLEFSVLRLLTSAMTKGDVYIITNAAPGWVEYSAERFYPSVKNILNKIKIISARGQFESKYPGDSRMWKIQAFLNMKNEFNSNLVTNILCLGDSFIEMEAAHVLASKFTQAFIKTVKFKESPKPEELNKQLSLVADQFGTIYSSVKNLTIRVEKKNKK
jgi:hypothetical protein